MRRNTAAVALIGALALSSAARAADAQPSPAAPSPAAPSPAALAEAKHHFQQGAALYNDQNFNAALAEFLAAYRAAPAPAVLYNIGLTQKALFRYNDALESLESYLKDEPKLTPERRAEVRQLMSEMRALLAEVTIHALPAGASIAVDGRTIGVSPMKPYFLAAGSHVLEVSAEGYRPSRKELLITAGAPLTVSVTLDKIPRTGRLHVAVNERGATVKVDNKDIGPPPQDLEVGLGGHTLEVWATGYETHREEVLVAAGQDRYLQVSLKRPPTKWYKKAAFWAPLCVAVAVAATAVGVAVSLTAAPEPPLTGTLNPGQGRVN
jgi:tetratricopeptide (TPR) repeat protein